MLFYNRHDWNSLVTDDFSLLFSSFTADLFPHADILVSYLNEFASTYELPIHYNTFVRSVKKLNSGLFQIETAHKDENRGNSTRLYTCATLLCGVGAVGASIPLIPGIELVEQYMHHDPTPALYRNKRVLIIGGGNSGFETADNIAHEAAVIHIALLRPVRHAWDSHFVGDLRAINNNLLDMYQLKRYLDGIPLEFLSVLGIVEICNPIVSTVK